MVVTHSDLISESGSGSKSGRSYERTYGVEFTGGWSVAYLLKGAHSLPKIGNVHPDDNRAKVSDVKPELDTDSDGDEGSGRYVVTYSPREADDAGEDEVSPLDRPAKISWGGGVGLTEVPDTDIDGAALVNSAGDYYPDIPERPVRGSSVTITRNEEENPAARVQEYSNTTNTGAWHGVAEFNGLMGDITAEPATEEFQGEDLYFWVVTYPIRLKRGSWKWKPIDNGWSKLNEDDEKLAATDATGVTAREPILLDGEGGELEDGADPVIYPEDGYKIIDEMSWSGLTLPNPFA